MVIRRMLSWALLAALTAAVTIPLTRVGVPSAALFAALVVGIVLALCSLAPSRVPRRAGVAAQGILGVYIGTMVHQDAVGALSSDWPIVLAVAVPLSCSASPQECCSGCTATSRHSPVRWRWSRV